MFKIKKNLVKRVRNCENDTISSIVDQNMTITGELNFKGKTRIDGTVNGNINGDYLILSRSGRINGDIKVVTFVCHGTLEGSIDADLVKVRKSSSISGKVAATNLVIEPGAVLDSEVQTSSETGPDRLNSAPYAQGRG